MLGSAAAIIALVVVGIIVGVVFLGGGSSSADTPATKLADASDVHQLLAGIPQRDNVLGKASAPVTMVEYVDLQCPFCQQFETSAMPTLISRYVRTGKLKVEARIVAFIGPDSLSGREAALAAGLQNKLFNFAQLLYDNQGAENTGWLDDSMVRAAAASIPGLDATRLLSDRNSSAVADEAKAVDAEASSQSVKATPTIFVGKSGTTPALVTLASPTDESSVAAAIDAALG